MSLSASCFLIRSIALTTAAFICFSALPCTVFAAEYGDIAEVQRGPEELQTPKTLAQLQEIPGYQEPKDDEKTGLPIDIRKEAVQEAALSFGARGGLFMAGAAFLSILLLQAAEWRVDTLYRRWSESDDSPQSAARTAGTARGAIH